jgi:hypothetical protein
VEKENRTNYCANCISRPVVAENASEQKFLAAAAIGLNGNGDKMGHLELAGSQRTGEVGVRRKLSAEPKRQGRNHVRCRPGEGRHSILRSADSTTRVPGFTSRMTSFWQIPWGAPFGDAWRKRPQLRFSRLRRFAKYSPELRTYNLPRCHLSGPPPTYGLSVRAPAWLVPPYGKFYHGPASPREDGPHGLRDGTDILGVVPTNGAGNKKPPARGHRGLSRSQSCER